MHETHETPGLRHQHRADLCRVAADRRRAASGSTPGPAAAQASSTLIPAILDLLAAGRPDARRTRRAGVRPRARLLHRPAHRLLGGAGPGAWARSVPVLPVDTLLAVAEEARLQHGAAAAQRCASGAARCAHGRDVCAAFCLRRRRLVGAGRLQRCSGPSDCRLARPARLLAGNVFTVYAEPPAGAGRQRHAGRPCPRPAAMLRLAPALLAAGHGVDAAAGAAAATSAIKWH